jgi:hypothetical protein
MAGLLKAVAHFEIVPMNQSIDNKNAERYWITHSVNCKLYLKKRIPYESQQC